MTVTNNEDRDALMGALDKAYPYTVRQGGLGPAADAILAAGFRRLPVSGDNAELIEDLRPLVMNPHMWSNEFISDTVTRAIAALEATSQPREAAPSDTALGYWMCGRCGRG